MVDKTGTNLRKLSIVFITVVSLRLFMIALQCKLSFIYESPEGSFEIQDSNFEIQHLRFKIQYPKYFDHEFRISNFRYWNSRFEIQYLKQQIKMTF